MSIQLIVGLGNPGAAYAGTRHNAGAWLVDSLADKEAKSFRSQKNWQSAYFDLNKNGVDCKVLKPLTYMNQSGIAVREVSHFYRIPVQNILVVHDELDLPPGRIKLKTGGGHGGHNGLRDIIAQLGSSDFHRLRVGIGHPGHRDLVLDYVLGTPKASDKTDIISAIDRALEQFPKLIAGDIALAMNTING